MKFLPVLRTKQELYAYYLPEYSLRALRVHPARPEHANAGYCGARRG